MIKFFILADADLPVLAYNMTKFMNSVQRNGGVVMSSSVIRDVGPPLLTGIVFYSEMKRERHHHTNNSRIMGMEDDDVSGGAGGDIRA